MSVAELWTAFSLLGFLVAVVGAYFARLEYHESKKDYQFSDRPGAAGTRLLARDQLRQRKTTYARLIIFALVMAGYTAVGAIAMSLPPPPSETAEAKRALLALILVSGEVLLVVAKTMDLYTLYQQRKVRTLWDERRSG